MRNEFLELRFDPYTGYLRAVYDNVHRGNRLSQQLGMRLKPAAMNATSDEEDDDYTIMAADDFSASHDDAHAQLCVSGRLMDRNGEIAARFSQTTTLMRGVPEIIFDITLDPITLPQKNAWQSYYANRFVWGEPACDIFRSVGMQAVKTDARKIEAPLFIDIRPIRIGLSTHAVNAVTKTVTQVIRRGKDGPEVPDVSQGGEAEYKDAHMTLLTGGLPFHRLVSPRRLDNLLIVHGETQRNFRLGVSLGPMYPTHAAMNFMSAPVQVPAECRNSRAGWVLRVDRKNVLITHWEPTAAGAVIRLAETQGRKTTVGLHAYKDIREAKLTDFLGDILYQIKTDAGAAMVDVPAYGWVQVEIEF